MTLRDLLQMVREGWAIVLAATLLGGVAGFAYTSTRTPQYEATSTLAVSACVAVENMLSCDPVGGMSFAVERARVYATAATSAPVLRDAAEQTGIVTSPQELAGLVTVGYTEGSPLIDVSVTWPEPEEAAELANIVAESLIAYSSESIDSFESDTTQVQFSVISEAVAPSGPTESDSRTILLSTVLGFLIGLVGAAVRWWIDTRVRDTQDAESISGLDVLAVIPAKSNASGPFHELRSIITSRLGDSAGADSVIAVISSRESSASPRVADGLAASFLSTRKSVALLSLSGSSGSADIDSADVRGVVEGRVSATEFVASQRNTTPMRFSFDGSADESAVALATPEFADLMAAVRGAADIVIVESAPATAASAMAETSRHADVALVVVEIGTTKRPELVAALRTLELIDTPALGLAAISSR